MTGKNREERKAAAILRAQLSLKQAIERVDYDYDVIQPNIERMRALSEGNTVTVKADEAIAALGAGDATEPAADAAW